MPPTTPWTADHARVEEPGLKGRRPRSRPIETAPTSALPTGPTRTTLAMMMMLRNEKVIFEPTSRSRTTHC